MGIEFTGNYKDHRNNDHSSSSKVSEESLRSGSELKQAEKEKEKIRVVKGFSTYEEQERAVNPQDAGIDEALAIIQDDEQFEYDEAEDAKVRRKIDLFVLPVMCITYGVQYLDKTAVSYAAVYGMKESAHLSGSAYSWLSTIFYLGYMIAQYPAGYLLQRYPIHLFLFTASFLWSACVLLMAACTNRHGLLALRFLSGVFEGCVNPAFVALTSMWYKREEQPVRTVCWYAFNGVSTMVGALLGYGTGHIKGSLPNWKYPFLVIGAISNLWSFVYIFFPKNPVRAKFLNSREKRIAIERVRKNRTGMETKKFKLSQALEAFKDPQVILMVLYNGMCQVTNAMSVFSGLIIQGMGYSGINATLLTLPSGAFTVGSMIFVGVFSHIFRRGRIPLCMFTSSLTIVGALMIWKIPDSNPWPRVVGVWLFSPVASGNALILSLLSSNIAGYSKKVTANATMFLFYSIGNIVSPQLFKPNQVPEYIEGIQASLVATCLFEGALILLAMYYIYENYRRDISLKRHPEFNYSEKNEEFLDRTDREQIKFRYIW
ncbi:major facilitator superfamily transporter [Schizosaccharomyces cryophilus OY26]|uniref:Major facilitator superfamily transporter n=1 Tax=Schizosaccharomyces cryophilus (strain OY26 / ATCC MYA-4695 / CBS 11777 / NBRC 106824 / NRRL Y48691) TaxID=653667 RepID=S9WZI5_SCHCR|nr:major facilitator superfamily transporter [Schizosaccharomyces cryophilus OY26]EPY50132.1 major facilitator superfamily transporter [Schizosaccharomyces cryophilus OY26]